MKNTLDIKKKMSKKKKIMIGIILVPITIFATLCTMTVIEAKLENEGIITYRGNEIIEINGKPTKKEMERLIEESDRIENEANRKNK